MDAAYQIDLARRLNFPQEAVSYFEDCLSVLEKVQADFDAAKEAYTSSGFDYRVLRPLLLDISRRTGLHEYTLMMLMMLDCAKEAEPLYDEETFLPTFEDLRYKLLECRYRYGICGTFVAFWYDIFFKHELFKLGRLEYQTQTYYEDKPYTYKGLTVKKGDLILNMHIPSSGEPFDTPSRLASYKKAYQYFYDKLYTDPETGRRIAVLVCHSWLLWPGYEPVWPQGSHIREFYHDFDVILEDPYQTFSDEWRMFGPFAQIPVQLLPENTRARKALKEYMLKGGKHGAGFGVIIFDGEKILNRS